jgi:hypothetical protein
MRTQRTRQSQSPQRSQSRLFSAISVWLAVALLTACARAPQTSSSPEPGSKIPSSIVDPYLKIATALAHDSTDGVKTNAGQVAAAAAALGAPAAKIDTAALRLTSAGDIADAREKFGALSEAIDAYMTGLHLTPPDEVKVAVCPMVQKPWMQKGGDIKNPYFGSQMLTCGSFRQ